MATDFQTSTYTASVQASPPSSIAASETKRNLFGRKKKSATNLGPSSSPSSSTLNSANSNSVESLTTVDPSESGKKKKGGVKNVFKRKSKAEGSNPDAQVVISSERDSSRGRIVQGDEQADGESMESDESGTELASGPDRRATFISGSSNAQRHVSRRSTSPIPSHPSGSANRSDPRPSTSGAEDRGEYSVDDQAPLDGTKVSAPARAGSRRRQSVAFPKVDTSAGTPNAPKITATPPTPTDQVGGLPAKHAISALVNGTRGGKRGRTNSVGTPSRLSQSMTTSPTPPGSSDGNRPQDQGNAPGGFFQSMFSAAQNAATSLTNNIPMNLANNGNRLRSGTGESEKNEGNAASAASSSDSEKVEPEKEPAVKTLGKGELDLATLGIFTDTDVGIHVAGTVASAGKTTDLFEKDKAAVLVGPPSDTGDRRVPQVPANAPLSAVNGIASFESGDGLLPSPNIMQGQPARTPMAEDTSFQGSRPVGRLSGDITPDRSSMVGSDDKDEQDGDRKRSGSVRSGATATTSKKRHRGSSAASSRNHSQPIPRPTGFAVASKKRNRDFHNLFKSVPEDDYLIEDYGCALQKEILLQGRLYVSEGHICFYSNILGWVTTLVISFDEVMSVEKKSTALVFPNAIVIQTLHAKHIFASFISRDPTYDLIIGLWNVGHPQLIQTPGETHLDNSKDGDVNYDSDEDDEEFEDGSDGDIGDSGTDAADGPKDDMLDGTIGSRPISRRPSQLPMGASNGEAKESGTSVAGDFPGPSTHAPTSCGDDDQHYDKPLCNEVLQVPLGRLYSLVFGSKSFAFVSRLLTEEEKVLELQIPNRGEWSDQDGKKTRSYSYVKPLNGSIGPKQTRCNITETIEFLDFEDHVSVTVSTQTPDVPSGGVFLVKTRYCLMWAEGDTTRMICNCTVEWSGKSWIKGPIEKGASDGQMAFNKSLLASLRKELVPKRASRPAAKAKGRRRKDVGSLDDVAPAATAVAAAAAPTQQPWGIFEPFRPVFSPIVDIIHPLLPANLSTLILVVVLCWLALGKYNAPREPVMLSAHVGSIHTHNGPSYWESMWQREEEGLWEWLEDRVGVDSVTLQKHQGDRSLLERKTSASMKAKQVEEAIRVMEERLKILKEVVEKKKNPAAASQQLTDDQKSEGVGSQ